jgi:hypothetical protein
LFSKIPDQTNRLHRLLRCHRGSKDLVKLTVPDNSKAKEATEEVVVGEAIKVVAAGDMTKVEEVTIKAGEATIKVMAAGDMAKAAEGTIRVMAAGDTTKAVEVTNNVVIAKGTVVREVTEGVTETTRRVRIRIIRLSFS